MAEVSQDPAPSPCQRRRLDPLPKKHGHRRRVVRKKRMRKSKRNVQMEAQCPRILPTPLAPPQSEEDEVTDKEPAIFSTREDDADLPSKDRLRSQQDEGSCVLMDQECQIQPCEISVAQEPAPSPAATSLASPPLCFGRFLSCLCPDSSKSRKGKLSRRKDSDQAKAGGDAKVPRSRLLKGLGRNKVQSHQSL
ncbi:uncharacterized protein LOC133751075 [Lepus europaeus]|uniref:uncharacterized protein LOC133751075 n=1 Tax=Lepus europaeus TaxID=9983 RepID=UPI002B4660DF|nr:uncharacterized protein LOC133751075 [Lepus europaeus]